MKNFSLVHPYCFANNIIVKTDKSLEELNKIIYLIQYIESDLPSVSTEGDGIYQTDLKIILSEFFNLETEEYKKQDIDYEIDILNNWEYGGNVSFEEYRKKCNLFNSLNEQEINNLNNSIKKELVEIAYKDGLELYLIDYRLSQIKNYRLGLVNHQESKDFKIFTAIKNAVLNKDEKFHWEGWCGRDHEINYKDYLININEEIK